ncbi:1,4-alpha-glucan branching protein GlgB [Lachnoclostridium pacaense]|uniref:1,4-alpha-glucan branching protein GlgB n=1 Tax=Enterocloster hominis (ex Hitch et al. 2024) TaxID=1917870 RepID=UPI001D0F687B|nr:1,4-alpha-glucan branching protein GlgB [Lachnoclostridium pacaense]MCC2875013.1 1,4-alpha-glucan branching protein GlgB [Lachnoclostridium pacaense]
MEQNLYDLMDWAGIEELVYSEASNPHAMLGPHLTESGLLIQALIPTAAEVVVKIASTGRKYPMELADEAGFFAVLIPRKSMAAYTLLVTYDNGVTDEIHDPYAYAPQFASEDLKKFAAGIHYSIYDKMGAHPMTINGVSGVYFSVWAPCAMRVSVVGDFNLWDGRRHQMRRIGEGDGSVFELFIPGLTTGVIYKYEVKTKAGLPMLKADPYGNYAELRPNNASVVWDINQYQWNDRAWMDKRAKTGTKDRPFNIYEVHLGSWMRKEAAKDESGEDIVGSEFYNYREIAVRLADYVQDMGYTHVELMPVMEHPLDESWGYQVTGYYAPTSRYGTPDDFMYFMDYMHGRGIGVILDWVPAHFPRDAYGMANFDGTCVYEHMDPRKGSHPHWGTLIYNYGRPGVSNFLIANALFWAEKYHADAIRMDAVASMLYLDYGKNDGEWVPNIYGGNENLEAVEFLKHLNSVFKGRGDGAVIIAEESTAWPMVTGNAKEGGLGFDYKWNMGWMNDFTNYMRCDPYFRKNNYGELVFSMLYAYSEDFVLVFSHDEVVHGKGSMIGKMPGATLEIKAENLRTAYAFMMGHPGKKLLFMGQEYAQVSEWNEGASLEWGLLELPVHKNMQDYVRTLNKLYLEHPALYEMDYDPEGFEWINCSYQNESMVMFVRKSKKAGETLLFICNFDNMEHEKFRVGVPFEGRYKEIFNTDAKEFGGSGKVNGRVKSSKKIEWDEKEDSIEVNIPPMSVSIYTCTPEPKAKKAGTGKAAAGKGQAAKTVKKAGSKAESKAGPGKKAEVKAEPEKKAEVKAEPEKKAEVKAKPEKKVEVKAEPEKKVEVKAESEKKVEVKAEPEKKVEVKAEPEKKVEVKAEPEKKAEVKSEPEKKAEKKPAPKRLSTKKEDQKKLTTAKTDQKQISTAKTDQKQISTAKTEQKQISTAKTDQKQISTSKTDQKQISTAKTDQKQISTAKTDQKQISTAKTDQKKLSTAKKETGRISTKKERTKQISTKKTDPKQISTSKTGQKRLGTSKAEAGKTEDNR